MVITFTLTYFLSINKTISEQSFQIPDSLIDTAIKLTAQSQGENTQEQTVQPSLSPEQIDLLKKNPELLKQSGLDPSILDNLNKSPNTPNDLIKQTIKDQVQTFLKPYLGFMPAGLAVLLFLTLQSLTSILNLLIYPLLWILFLVFEKTGFVKFTIEQRPVKKMAL